LKDAGVKVLLIEEEEQWKELSSVPDQPETLSCILSLAHIEDKRDDARLKMVDDWLPEKSGAMGEFDNDPETLATIVYTSGTTGYPKGVMLSHKNILWNAYRGLQSVSVYREDNFLSFLPLSHTFERTIGYYLPMMAGATITYVRSIAQIGEDILVTQPTVIISVPRLFERIYNTIKAQLEEKGSAACRLFEWTVAVGWRRFEYQQKRGKWSILFLTWPLLDLFVARKIRKHLGGNLRLTLSGGAALSIEVSRVFLALGIQLLQGYGMTETSPVISVNKLHDNKPASVGQPLKDVQVRVGKEDELQVKSPGVTLGYWNNPAATAQLIDKDGWLHTGDKARIEYDHIFITGRIKEILVMANGEKFPPVDIELAIQLDPLIEQVMVIGEGKPYISALVVLNKEDQKKLATETGQEPDNPALLSCRESEEYILKRIAKQMRAFLGSIKVYRAALLQEPWTVENGLLTPTLKLRRNKIIEEYNKEIAKLYEGH
jgi:long-chain acyl-CoA synthetase